VLKNVLLKKRKGIAKDESVEDIVVVDDVVLVDVDVDVKVVVIDLVDCYLLSSISMRKN
jgi:uncharacterized protein YuzE